MEDAFDPIASIASERDATRGFIDLLQREQRTLQQGDISSLISLTNEKTHRMQQLAQMADARKRWLAAFGHTSDRSGIECVLPDYPVASEVWKDLLQLAKMAVQLNKINGILIDQRLRYNQQALAVLQAATPQNSGLYGSDGQPQTLSGGRQLGEG